MIKKYSVKDADAAIKLFESLADKSTFTKEATLRWMFEIGRETGKHETENSLHNCSTKWNK